MTATKRHLEGPDLDRAATLRAEGLPASWIAEDLDCRRESIFRSGILAGEAAAQWRSVWPAIRTNPALAALHREFQPDARYRV